MKRLGSDLTSAQKEMKAKHKAYENAVGILSRRLQESLAAKESAEAELSKLKAQITDGGNNQIAQVCKCLLTLLVQGAILLQNTSLELFYTEEMKMFGL